MPCESDAYEFGKASGRGWLYGADDIDQLAVLLLRWHGVLALVCDPRVLVDLADGDARVHILVEHPLKQVLEGRVDRLGELNPVVEDLGVERHDVFSLDRTPAVEQTVERHAHRPHVDRFSVELFGCTCFILLILRSR